jgi:hypothetical protein
MASNALLPAYDRFLEFVLQKATPEEILALQASEEEQERAQELIERNSAGILTPEERAELEQMLALDRIMSVLKAKALGLLHKS